LLKNRCKVAGNTGVKADATGSWLGIVVFSVVVIIHRGSERSLVVIHHAESVKKRQKEIMITN
jgi:hypothetical protein